VRALYCALLVAGCSGGAATGSKEPEPAAKCDLPAATGGSRTTVTMEDTEDVCPLFAAVGVTEAAEVAEARGLEATKISCPGTEGIEDSVGMTVSCYVDVTASSVAVCRAFAARLLLRHAQDHHRVNLSIDCHPGEVSARTSRGDFEVDVGDDYWIFKLGS
jgi:hypothetical protein